VILAGVTPSAEAWSGDVRMAAIAGDHVALARLFSQAEAHFGAQAAQKWAELLSAYDAGAQTG
jgi:hypothetical protein